MSEPKLVILGSSGLLGSAVLRRSAASDVPCIGVSRTGNPGLYSLLRDPDLLFKDLEIRTGDMVFNAIGKTKQKIDIGDQDSVIEAKWLNSALPSQIASACARNNVHYLQIGTDCVFSGDRGNYTELDDHDARDIYGITKSDGESSEHVNLIRTSFVGPSHEFNPGLWGWVSRLERHAEITGYTNHLWNGVSVGAIAEIVIKVFSSGVSINGAQHLVPKDRVTKLKLVELIARRLGRNDLRISSGESEVSKDMTLRTVSPAANSELWSLAGYVDPPTVEELIESQQIDH